MIHVPPKYTGSDVHCSIIPDTVKTKQVNRKDFKINYGYNPTLDSDQIIKRQFHVCPPGSTSRTNGLTEKQEKDSEDTH